MQQLLLLYTEPGVKRYFLDGKYILEVADPLKGRILKHLFIW